MSKIYAAFSNHDGDLKQVTKEFSVLFNFFNSKEIKQKTDFGFALNPPVDTLTSDILAGQKEIRVFLFSGHSGNSGLDFGKEDFTSSHLKQFFNTINADDSKIDCVILNGCTNDEIVSSLSHVPVVIGTATEINDEIAQKFTVDFFRALIESEASYKSAFAEAIAAQDNITSSIHTRSESGGSGSVEPRLNHYFMSINDRSVAEGPFPFKRKPLNWTKYLFILFLCLIGLAIFLFRESLMKMYRGYSCTMIENGIDKDKCNFVIADFSTDQGLDFAAWLHRNIETSPDIKDYLNCINITSFSRVITDNAVDQDSFPALCCYDFHLTGSYTKERDKLRAEINVYPFDPDQLSSSTFVYHVEALGELDTLITFLDTATANQFVLFEMCASCAVQKGYKNILPAMVKLLDTYKYDAATAPSFQRLQQRLSDAALHSGDTLMALRALDQVASAAQNDFALWALEEKTKIYEVQKDIPNQYLAQTTYLNAMEMRLKVDTIAMTKKKKATYKEASHQIRLRRAALVTKNDEVLKDKKPEAIKDYENLDKAKYKGQNYSKEIQVLKGNHVAGFSPGDVNDPNEFALSPGAAMHEGVKAGSVPQLIKPGVLLTQPALVDPGAVTKFNTGFVLENNVIEQLHVAVITQAKDEKRMQEVAQRLIDFGYIVDKDLSRANVDEKNPVLKSPTVIFSNPEMKVKAYHLARMLSKEYAKEFEVLPSDKVSAYTSIIPSKEKIDFVVYWAGQ